MGAWGTGIFDDDTALDFVGDVRSADDPLSMMQTALECATNADYLEYDGACAAIVVAAIVDSVQVGSRLDPSSDDQGLDEWVRALDRASVVAMSARAAAALSRVLSDGCELRELWEENEADFPVWSGTIKALRSRLGAPSED
jgi:hypothetical protein